MIDFTPLHQQVQTVLLTHCVFMTSVVRDYMEKPRIDKHHLGRTAAFMCIRGTVTVENSFITAMMATVFAREIEYFFNKKILERVFPEKW